MENQILKTYGLTKDEIQAKITAGMKKYHVMLLPSIRPDTLKVVPHQYVKYDKKLKKYYLKVNVAKYKKIISKKARVYIKLIYLNNRFELTTYTKYDHKHNPMPTDIVRDYTIYKSSKSIKKLNKSKTKKQYTY